MRGAGRAVFAAILLVIAGCSTSSTASVLSAMRISTPTIALRVLELHTWGWITIILGVIQLTGGFSLMAGSIYGRVIGITAASLGAIGALLSVGGAYPFWSLGIFALCVIVLHGIVVYGEDESEPRYQEPPRA